MDPVAHVLAGSAIARAGFQRSLPEKRATAIGVVAANIPDLDLVELLWASEEQFVYHHRSLTHSLLGWLIASLVLAWGCRRIWKDMDFRPAARRVGRNGAESDPGRSGCPAVRLPD